MSNAQQIAETIQEQIGGGRAFYMMGAKDLAYSADGSLSWRVGRNPKGVTHVRVALDQGTDTYTATFQSVNMRRSNPDHWVKVLAELEGIFVEQLRGIIQAETGLALSL